MVFGVTGVPRALSANITGLANEPELTTTGLRGDLGLQQRAHELAQLFPDGLPTLKEAEHILSSEALRRADGNQGIAAGMLGRPRQALNKRLIRNRQAVSIRAYAGASLRPELFRPRALYHRR